MHYSFISCVELFSHFEAERPKRHTKTAFLTPAPKKYDDPPCSSYVRIPTPPPSGSQLIFFCHYNLFLTLFEFKKSFFQIMPEQVTGPCQPGPVFIVIDCPTLAFIPSLVSNKRLRQHWEGQYWEEGPNRTPVVMVHLTPMRVFQNKEYEKWRKR